MTTATTDYTALAIDELVAEAPDKAATRQKAEEYVAAGKCYCCGGSSGSYDGDPIQRCYICWGRGHGDDVLPPELLG